MKIYRIAKDSSVAYRLCVMRLNNGVMEVRSLYNENPRLPRVWTPINIGQPLRGTFYVGTKAKFCLSYYSGCSKLEDGEQEVLLTLNVLNGSIPKEEDDAYMGSETIVTNPIVDKIELVKDIKRLSNNSTKIYKIAWKHAQEGTYSCLQCITPLVPFDVVLNSRHHFPYGQLYKCQCGKSQLWANSIRYPDSLKKYCLGKEFPSSQDPEMWGFCNDEFCPLCWKHSGCVKNGTAEETKDKILYNKICKIRGIDAKGYIGYDLFGCQSCNNIYALAAKGKLGEFDGQEQTAIWYKEHKNLWWDKV